MFIDTHAHLFFENFKDDFDAVIERAKNAGIEAIIIPATDLKTSEEVITLIEKYDFLYGTVGVHPHDTKDWTPEWRNRIEALAAHKKIVAIGEIGLDYFYDFSPKEKQKEAFITQLDLALQLDLPVVIHNRDADNDIMEIFRPFSLAGLKAQFHCFNGSLEIAKELVSLNQSLSFTGNITFKKADELRSIVSQIPLENVFIETDSPFMTPVPHRGKRNEPAYVTLVADTLALLHNKSVQEIGEITTNNAMRFFGLEKTKKLVFTYQLSEALYINVTNRCNADCI